MGDKTPMFNAFNINFYRAGLEDADDNGTFIQYCTRNHFHGSGCEYNTVLACRGKLFSFQSCLFRRL